MTTVVRILPATGGCDFVSAPDALAQDKAPLVANLIGDRAGALRPRGPWLRQAQLGVSGFDRLLGAWTYNDNILLSRDSGGATTTPWGNIKKWWGRHITNNNANAALAMQYVSAGVASAVSGATTQQVAGWGGRTQWKDKAWGFAAADNVAPSSSGSGFTSVQPGPLASWDGTATALTAQAAGPRGGADVAVFAQRLWVGGGIPFNVAPGANTIQAQRLYFSRIDDPTTWSDDVAATVRVATTVNLAALNGLIAVDGVTVAAGDRVLVKDQTTPAQNGIYVASAGAWTRATDADTWAEVIAASSVHVTEGTVNVRLAFSVSAATTGASSPTLGTTAIAYNAGVAANPNQIVVDSGEEDGITGLATVNGALIVFMSNSIFQVVGSGTSTFRVRRVASNVGCIDARSIVLADDGTYFMGKQGLYFTDGYSVSYLSAPVEPYLRPALADVGARTQVAQLASTDWLLVNQVVWSTTATALSPIFTALFNRRTGAWIVVDTIVGDFSLGRTTATSRLGTMWLPTRNPAGLVRLGSGTVLAINTSTVYSGVSLIAGTSGTGDDRACDSDGTSDYPIPCLWYSGAIRLCAPLQVAQLQKFMLDYKWKRASGSTAGIAWRASLVDGLGNTLMAEQTTVAEASNAAVGFRRRFQVETFAEAADCQLRLRYTGPTGTAAVTTSADVTQRAEVFEAAIEYQDARKRPTV